LPKKCLNLQKIRKMRTVIPANLYFIGAGGIGMSALARYFNMLGKRVAGYDLTRTRLTDNLEKEGIELSFEDDESKIPAAFLEPGAKEQAIIIYTPAIPPGNRIFQFFTGKGYHVVKRSRLLGELVNDARGIAVAGTHGKTSVSALTAHILKGSAMGCNAFLGGLAKNYDSNLIVDDKSDLVVAEADEYDRSFLQLFPSVAVITSMDPDHLDIYGDFDSMKQAFITFASQVKDEGVLIYRKGLDVIRHLPGDRASGASGKDPRNGKSPGKGIRTVSFGIGQGADFSATNISITGNGLPLFDIKGPGIFLEGITLGVPGRFNVENAVAATAAALSCGANLHEIKKGLESYQGLSRRFEILVNHPGCVLIDDYAHHPAELNACISAAREIFPGRKITGIFQPHLYTRTRDFADGFARSLEALDELILLDIYPARELPLPGVSSRMILDRVGGINKILCGREELVAVLSGQSTDIVLTMGAGNIDALVEHVRKVLLSKCRKQ
jgi:UDP-N-acetylmuramate--alanine ligase